MRLILIILITYVYTAIASSVQDESTNVADLLPPIDSSNQIVSWDLGNLASSNDLTVADSPSTRASPPVPLNLAISSNPPIAANPSDPTTSSNQNSPLDQITSSNSIQIASSRKLKGHCSPSGTQTNGKVRRGESCSYSWDDNPNSREDFTCPVEFYFLCCKDSIFSAWGCIECKRLLLHLSSCGSLANKILRVSD